MRKITLLLFLFSTLLSFSQATTFTVEVPPGTEGVRMTGPWWGWNPLGGPIAVDNGDDTFTVTLFDGSSQAQMEYLWVITNADGSATAGSGQEILWDNASNGECTDRIIAGTLITDYASWGNRIYLVGPTSLNEVYDSCAEETLSLNNVSLKETNIFPNHTSNVWNLTSKNQRISKLDVFDIFGKNVINITPEASETTINATELNSGLYIAKIYSETGMRIVRLIKK